MWMLRRLSRLAAAAFGEMVAYLRAHPAVRVLLVEKTAVAGQVSTASWTSPGLRRQS
jgi:hypothetical protein